MQAAFWNALYKDDFIEVSIEDESYDHAIIIIKNKNIQELEKTLEGISIKEDLKPYPLKTFKGASKGEALRTVPAIQHQEPEQIFTDDEV